MSYAEADDDYLNGGITWLRDELLGAMRAQTGDPLRVLQNAEGVFVRSDWPARIEDALTESNFLIPILSPSYFVDINCRQQFLAFLDLEKKTGRQDLIWPIYLMEAGLLEDSERRIDDVVANALHNMQYIDWRDSAFELRTSPRIKQNAFELAKQIKAASERTADDAPPDIPEQGPGVRFRINEEGLIDRAPDEPHDADENEARLDLLKTGLMEACDRLLGSSGHNTLGFVLDTVRAYRGAIDRPLIDVQYTDVWRHGQRLQNLADAATREVDRLEPSLEDDQHAALNDLLDLHGPFMLSTAEGRALQAMADRYQATREQQARQKEAVQAFKEAIEDSTGLVTDAVKQVIAEASDELGKGRYPERAAITAETTNWNFLSTVGKAAAHFGDRAAGGIIGGIAAGTAIGGNVIGVSVEALNLAGEASKQFLLAHEMILKGLVACSTDSLAWLNHLIGWLGQRAPLAPAAQPALNDAPANATNDVWVPGCLFCDIEEDWCPSMIVIQPGEFLLGSPETEEGREDWEGPQHWVKIENHFGLGLYPVTFEQYDYYCQQTGIKYPDDEGWGRGRRPVINVSQVDAKAYCNWLAEITGASYQLPTEAQWEYACRAGSTTAYCFGESIRKTQANLDRHIGKTKEVAAYPANSFNVRDMHGNVFEWCEDRLLAYEGGMATRPHLDGTNYVVRGGSWTTKPIYARSAFRGGMESDRRTFDCGFRCVRILE